MKSYNGFPAEQRERAQRWLRAEWAAGRLRRPVKCCACGQANGIFDAHAEDYSDPFAAGKTDEFHLCFTCHMMLHCRFRNPAAWARYRDAIRAGGYFAPFYVRNFGQFTGTFLDGPDRYAAALKAFTPGPMPKRMVLDEIEASKRLQVAHRARPADLFEGI